MTEGTDLCDDSALINAFNAAMASYKEIHGTSTGAPDVEKQESNSSESGSAPHVEKQENNCNQSDYILTSTANCERRIEFEGDNLDKETILKETCASSSNVPAATNDVSTQENNFDAKVDAYSISDHHIPDYNELLKQYDELEKRKQEVADQLHRANYWNYQQPVQGSTSQLQQPPVNGSSQLNPNITSPWCTCHGLAATLNSNPACPMASMLSGGYACCPLCCSGLQVQQIEGAHCFVGAGKCPMLPSFPANHTKHSGQGDGFVVENIMVMEGAGYHMNEDVHRTYNPEEEKQNVGYGSSNLFKGQDVSAISTKTDLNAVLNAWYWAGYHTGRYLIEQEQEKTKEV